MLPCWFSLLTAWRMRVLYSHCHCHCMLTKLLMLLSPPLPCGPGEKILLCCTVAHSFWVDFPMSLPGSVALSLFSTSKETSRKERERKRNDRHWVREGAQKRRGIWTEQWENVTWFIQIHLSKNREIQERHLSWIILQLNAQSHIQNVQGSY